MRRRPSTLVRVSVRETALDQTVAHLLQQDGALDACFKDHHSTTLAFRRRGNDSDSG
jgi:hypothetical protein